MSMIKKIVLLWLISQGLAVAEISIPEPIKVPVGFNPVLTVHAKGDQIYQCTVNKGAYSWQTQAPDARLFDEQGQIVGNHSAGPVWEYKEGSRVLGRVVSKLDRDPEKSISWLLVAVVSHKGDGLFANVDFINRINTRGGLPPLSGCDANHLGTEKRSGYSADYIFYAK